MVLPAKKWKHPLIIVVITSGEDNLRKGQSLRRMSPQNNKQPCAISIDIIATTTETGLGQMLPSHQTSSVFQSPDEFCQHNSGQQRTSSQSFFKASASNKHGHSRSLWHNASVTESSWVSNRCCDNSSSTGIRQTSVHCSYLRWARSQWIANLIERGLVPDERALVSH